MKKLILLELALLFLATTFQSDNPPGWYQQQLPVNNLINDICFIDSLKGWIVTERSGGTAYILHTTNGGNNWNIQFQQLLLFTALQFIDSSTGYVVGSQPPGIILKTTNGGNNWFNVSTLSGYPILDLSFVNIDTGWICIDDPFAGGIFKTTNGGVSWVRQLDQTFKPTKLFFLNKDTGWASCNSTELFRTTNGGTNWNLQFNSAFPIGSIFFLNGQKGWIRGGPDLIGNGVSYTTNGGFNWISSIGNTAAGYDIKFINDSVGYTGMQSFRIPKSIDGGRSWGYQTSPIYNNMSVSFLENDTLKGWAGGTGIVTTNDGGGLIVDINQSEIEIIDNFTLHQNYPNPFNPVTVISYQLTVSSYVKLKVFDMQGKEIAELINNRQSPGEYEVSFDGNSLSSGVYFYKIEIVDENLNKVFTDTKKMVLVR